VVISRKFFSTFLTCSAVACAADPGLLNLVMPDAQVFAGINVERIAASPIGKEIGSKIQGAAPQIQQILSETGFDPARDLKEILIAATAQGQNGPALFLVRGSFDAAKFSSLISSSGQKAVSYQGVQILSNPAQKSGSVAFLDGGIAVAGDLNQVRAAIRRRTHGTSISAELAAKIATLSDRYDIWFHTSVPVTAPGSSVPDPRLQPAADLLKSIQQISGGVKFSSGVDLTAEIETRSEKEGAIVLGALQLFSGFLTANTQSPAALKPDALKLSLVGKTVRVALAITGDQLHKAYEVQMARNAGHAAGVPTMAQKARPADSGGLMIQSSDKDMGTVTLTGAK
jgi:hypothetical protein